MHSNPLMLLKKSFGKSMHHNVEWWNWAYALGAARHAAIFEQALRLAGLGDALQLHLTGNCATAAAAGVHAERYS